MSYHAYNARAEGDKSRLPVLAPHSIVLPGIGIPISVEHRNNRKLELVNKAGDLLVRAIPENEFLGKVGHNSRSNPL